jgi:hypothetical protein
LIKGIPNVRYVALPGAEHGSATQPAGLDEIERFLDALPAS